MGPGRQSSPRPPHSSSCAAMPLDVKQIEVLKPGPKPYRRSDGGGLLLEVRPSGAKVWLCRLIVAGKRRDMGLGGYPTVSLRAARAAARAAKEKAATGVDPIDEKQGKTKALLAERRAKAASRSGRGCSQATLSRSFRHSLLPRRSETGGWFRSFPSGPSRRHRSTWSTGSTAIHRPSSAPISPSAKATCPRSGDVVRSDWRRVCSWKRADDRLLPGSMGRDLCD